MTVCRLCQLPDPHVHVTQNLIAFVHRFARPPKKLKIRKISNVDWSVPAINYSGRWYEVPLSLVEEVWPMIQPRLRFLRKPEQQDEDHEVEDQSDL